MNETKLRSPDKTKASGRSMTYLWRTPCLDPTSGSYAGFEAYAELYMAHNADRKEFFATVNTVKYGNNHGVDVRMFEIGQGVTVLQERIGRYSPVALERFAEKAFDTFQQRIDEERITAIFPVDAR